MKFYLEQIQVLSNDTEAKGLFEYDSQDEAEIAFSNTMAASINNAEVKYVRCKVINDAGDKVFLDSWQADEEEVFEQKYYLSQIQYPVEGESVKALFDCPTFDDALDAWYTVRANSMSDTNLNGFMAMIEDRDGNEIKRRYWMRGTEEGM